MGCKYAGAAVAQHNTVHSTPQCTAHHTTVHSTLQCTAHHSDTAHHSAHSIPQCTQYTTVHNTLQCTLQWHGTPQCTPQWHSTHWLLSCILALVWQTPSPNQVQQSQNFSFLKICRKDRMISGQPKRAGQGPLTRYHGLEKGANSLAAAGAQNKIFP